MEKIITLIKNKNWAEILNYSKSMTNEERYSTIEILKGIDIDKYIVKKDTSKLFGQEREEYFQNRREMETCQNYFFVTCIRSFDDLRKVEIEEEFFTENPFYNFISTDNFKHLIEFYKLFPPNYLNKVIEELSKENFRNFNFKTLWKCYENNWVDFDEEFYLRRLLIIQMFDRSTVEDANFLLHNIEALEKVFLKFYKYETPILDISKWDAKEGIVCKKVYEFWTEVIVILQEHGYTFDRSIITNLFESLLNNWKRPHLDWHVRLLELFQPSKEELITNQSTLISILGTGQPSLINYVILKIKVIYQDKNFDALTFMDNVPIIFSNNKITKSLFVVLEIIEHLLAKSIKVSVEFRELLCLLFIQTDTKIQEKVAKILVQYFNDIQLHTIVFPYSQNLKQIAKDILKIKHNISENVENTISINNIIREIIPLRTWDELLLHIGTCIRTKSAKDIEIFFESIIQLQALIPPDYEKQIKPYTKNLFGKYYESDTLTAFIFFLHSWIAESTDEFLKIEFKYLPFLGKKAQITYLKLKGKSVLPFLSTPTHEPFYVHPKILLERVLQHEKNNETIDLEDLIVACNRIIVSELKNDFSKSLKQIKGEYSNALCYLFGVSDQINFTNDTLPLWTQISRIKNPNGIFAIFEKSKASNYPSVVNPFQIRFEIEKNTTYNGIYKLILDDNWNYNWYNNNKPIRHETIFYNTASADKASRIDIDNQMSLNPNYIDTLLCRYIPDTSSGNEIAGFEECLYPMKFILENQLSINHSGWLYVAVCLLFEKKISRDLASEYIHLSISRNENLDILAEMLGMLINERYAPVNRLIEYFDKPTNIKEIKLFQFDVLANCIRNFDMKNLPINSKKILQYYKEFQVALDMENTNEIMEKLLEFNN